ncbi:MAG: hypothetical protein ACYCSQ_09290 [bacterium]
MKETILSAAVSLLLLLITSCFNPHNVFPYNHIKHPRIKTHSEYSSILKRLTFYKRDLVLLSSKISKKRKDIANLKNKIKIAKNKIKKLKNKIKKGDLLIKDLTIRIFLINREDSSAKLSSSENNAEYFIVNYQLKTLLKKEEIKLSKLIKRRNRFLKLKKYLKKEKAGLIPAVNSINGSISELKGLIGGIDDYIKSVKIKYNRGNKIQNKKNRLLKRKVIKLIHNLNGNSRKDDIKFFIMR